MTTYYQGPEALVTEEIFEVRHPYQRFRVAELHDVQVIRWPLEPAVARSVHTTTGIAVMVMTVWPIMHSFGAWILAVVLFGVSCLLGGLCLKLRPRTYELRATYRSYQIMLYASNDSRAFEQIRRSLVRALERQGSAG